MADKNPFSDIYSDKTDPDNPFANIYAEPPSALQRLVRHAWDVVKQIPAGLIAGTETVAAFPAQVAAAVAPLANKFLPSDPEAERRQAELLALTSKQRGEGISQYLPKPETTSGRFARTGAEFVPSVVAGSRLDFAACDRRRRDNRRCKRSCRAGDRGHGARTVGARWYGPRCRNAGRREWRKRGRQRPQHDRQRQRPRPPAMKASDNFVPLDLLSIPTAAPTYSQRSSRTLRPKD